MNISEIAKILIIIHAICGSIALIAGTLSMIFRKGQKWHKLTGKVFYIFMTATAVSALIVAVMPGHVNPFLFTIGVFTWYLVWTGNAALRYKNKDVNITLDKIVSLVMLFTGVGMVLYPYFVYGKIIIVLAFFGLFGVLLALMDLNRFRNPETLRQVWLKLHITKMIGGYIAAFTAFIVVTGAIPGIAGWLLPTAPGVAVIFYWVRKIGNTSRKRESIVLNQVNEQGFKRLID